MRRRVHMLPKTVISRYSNTYAKKRKRLGILILPLRAASNGHLHILEYLVEREYDNYDEMACERAAKNGHLDCLKYLHETAKAPWDYGPYETRTRKTNPNVYNTSSTTTVLSHRLAIRARRVIHSRTRVRRIRVIYTTHKHTHTHYSS